MKHLIILLTFLSLALAGVLPAAPTEEERSASPGAAGGEAFASSAVPAALMSRTDTETLLKAASSLSTVSVSPTGRYIAAVDRSRISVQDRFAADVANPMGRLPQKLLLFARHDDGYLPDREIPLDQTASKELSSTFGGGAALCWSADETRCIVSLRWTGDTRSYITRTHSNLYLMDMTDGTVRQLTQNTGAFEHCYLPAWHGDSAIRYLRLSGSSDPVNVLCELDIRTGEETVLATLYSEGMAIIDHWAAVGSDIYYTADVWGMGKFLRSPMGGGKADARCLLDQETELRETGKHPYCRGFSGMDVTADGRWACLTITDQRVPRLDFPFADSPQLPQSDPADALSLNGRPWTPCHNVLLYDIPNGRLAEPFRDPRLVPTESVVTAACFAPDGRTLLCAVFGDGKPWTLPDTQRTVFYEIELESGGMNAVRLFETELRSSLWFPEGLSWQTDDLIMIPTDEMPALPVQLLRLYRAGSGRD